MTTNKSVPADAPAEADAAAAPKEEGSEGAITVSPLAIEDPRLSSATASSESPPGAALIWMRAIAGNIWFDHHFHKPAQSNLSMLTFDVTLLDQVAVPRNDSSKFLMSYVSTLEKRLAKTEQEIAFIRPLLPELVKEEAQRAEVETEITTRIRELGVLLGEDEVDAQAVYLSLKKSLGQFRAKHRHGDSKRRFALGLIHDAIIFTKLSNLSASGIVELERAVSVALHEPLESDALDRVQDILEHGGFELAPVSLD